LFSTVFFCLCYRKLGSDINQRRALRAPAMNLTEAATALRESAVTVPGSLDPITVRSGDLAAATVRPPVASAPRRPAVRELASWRVLRMWADGESLQEAVTVKLIGVHEGNSIVVTAPEGESALQLVEGAVYKFRSFSGECIYEFAAPLLKICAEPFSYLHVGWPQERQIEKRDLRAATRVKTELPCMVYPGKQISGKFAKGTITDLSTGGAAIALHDELSLFYDEVRLVFRLNVAEQEVLVEARARPVRKPEESGERSLGVSFVGLGEAERLALHAYVYSALVRELEVPLYAM
jgi:c-di-GMP-binding flagellar brake protein YcgR